MPQQSKYSDAEFENLTHELMLVLEKHQAKTDLSIMVLGNLLSNIFLHQVGQAQRSQMAEQFTQVLLKSINSDKKES